MLRKILLVTAILSLIIFIHELGHLVAAVLLKIEVEEFSIGFGPAVISFHLGSLLVKIRPILFGGFNSVDASSFAQASMSTQAIFCVAGMLFNTAAAFFVNLWMGGPRLPHLPFGVKPKSFGVVLGSLFEPLWVWVTYPYVVWREVSKGRVRFIELTPVSFYSSYGNNGWSGFRYFGLTNMIVAGCNLLPIFPLDGGKLALIGVGALGVKRPLLVYLVIVECFLLLVLIRKIKKWRAH